MTGLFFLRRALSSMVYRLVPRRLLFLSSARDARASSVFIEASRLTVSIRSRFSRHIASASIVPDASLPQNVRPLPTRYADADEGGILLCPNRSDTRWELHVHLPCPASCQPAGSFFAWYQVARLARIFR